MLSVASAGVIVDVVGVALVRFAAEGEAEEEDAEEPSSSHTSLRKTSGTGKSLLRKHLWQ